MIGRCELQVFFRLYGRFAWMFALCAVQLAALPLQPASAQTAVQNPYMAVSLEAGPERNGGRTIAIVMTPRPGWHTYWVNPGSAGVETQADWKLPAQARASDIRYPVPSRFVVSGIMNYVFEEERALLVDVRGLPQRGRQPFRLALDYLVCDDQLCVPERAELSGQLRDIEVAARRIARWEAHQPVPFEGRASFSRSKDERLRLAVAVPNLDDVRGAYFFPRPDGALDYDAPQTASRSNGTLVIETDAGFAEELTSLPGVLKLRLDDGKTIGLEIEARRGSVPAAGVLIGPAASTGGSEAAGWTGGTRSAGELPLALMFGFALLGGFILNAMPCVFPILSLKALSLVKSGISARGARSEALFYTGGIVTTVLALGGALLALRAGGASVGWAFQLQDPRVVLLLLLFVTAIALNLAGLFELPSISLPANSGAASDGPAGSFLTGALAAVIATPCTGPFMGAALGAALFASTAGAFAIFLGFGLGLALPFLLIGFLPALRSRLPKPGAWTAKFRRLLSLPMFATALGLAWVLGRQAGVEGLTLGMGAALLLGLALWWLGSARRKALPLAAAAATLAAVLFVAPNSPISAAAAEGERLLAAAPYSPARLGDLRAGGEPVFLYFTADWCITCKVNERGPLSSARVAEHFADAGIRTLVGDWTRADPQITDYLTAQGRAGVPLYVYYAPGEDARILPQILTADMLTALGGRREA